MTNNTKGNIKGRSDAGWFTVDAIGALLIFVILIPMLHNMWQMGINHMKQRSVAEHFITVQKAASLYGKQFHVTLLPLVTETTGPGVSLATLKSTKCLADHFNDTNAWGQSYNIVARKDKTGDLAMVVLTTGGREHSNKTPEFANVIVPETAALAKAGFIPTGILGASSVIRGAYDGWEIPLASLGVTATPGHLASISTLSSSDLDQDFLYRVAVPGEPELNAMQTSLDMTNHSIRGVQELSFVSKDFASVPGFCTSSADEGATFLDANQGLYLCRDGKAVVVSDSGNSLMMQEAQLASNNQLIEKPVCPPGTNTHPEIFVTPSIVSSGADSPVAASIQAWAVNASATQWSVRLRILNAQNQWVFPSANYGRVIVMTTCAKD